ncbi:protein of unknown function DUF1643 [Synechococcus sp. WH 8101]|nr:protein of unknown function DUF1643 [Synechococcus sp. WH 8101]
MANLHTIGHKGRTLHHNESGIVGSTINASSEAKSNQVLKRESFYVVKGFCRPLPPLRRLVPPPRGGAQVVVTVLVRTKVMGKSFKGAAVKSDAIFSDCRTYRYALWRLWDDSRPCAMFIGLNPSSADEAINGFF